MYHGLKRETSQAGWWALLYMHELRVHNNNSKSYNLLSDTSVPAVFDSCAHILLRAPMSTSIVQIKAWCYVSMYHRWLHKGKAEYGFLSLCTNKTALGKHSAGQALKAQCMCLLTQWNSHPVTGFKGNLPFLYSAGSQLGLMLCPSGHLAVPGDMLVVTAERRALPLLSGR